METAYRSFRLTLAIAVICVGLAATAAAETMRLPLSDLAGEPYADLQGQNAARTLSVPIPDRWRMVSARLHLTYRFSSALDPRSRLTVRLGGYPLAQAGLVPPSTTGEIDVDIPVALLFPGFNDLTVSAAQSYTSECMDPYDPVLWTTLLLKDSVLTVDYEPLDPPASLADAIPFMFDPKNPATDRVHLAVEGAGPEFFKATALAASGAALRFGWRPVSFTLSSGIDPEVDNIVIGTPAYVAAQCGEDAAVPENGIAVVSLAAGQGTTGRAALVLSGATAADRERVAAALALWSFPFPDGSAMAVGNMTVPPAARYAARNMMTPGREYKLAELGFETITRRGSDAGPVGFSFRIPPDLRIIGNAVVALTMNLTYGAVMRSDSTVNILLNDRVAGAIPLNDMGGGQYRGYKLNLPNALLKPGENRLVFEPVLVPRESGRCRAAQTRNLAVTILDDSTLSIPRADHWVALPDLQLYLRDGFPLTRFPDWGQAAVWLADATAGTAAAAINMIAMTSRKSGLPPLGLTVVADPKAAGDRDLLVLSTMAAIPSDMARAAPWADGVPARLDLAPEGRPRPGWVASLLSLEGGEPERERLAVSLPLEAKLDSGRLVIAEFAAPWSEASSVVLVAAADEASLLKGARDLWDPALRGRIGGAMAVLDLKTPVPLAASFDSGKRYYVGRLGVLPVLDRLVYRRPVVFFAAAFVVVVLFALLLRSGLRRHQRKRLRQAAGKNP